MKYTIKLIYSGNDVSLKDKEKEIIDAIDIYNNMSYSMQNPKVIELLELEEKNMTLALTSNLVLSAPGKALRTFSHILVKEKGFIKSKSGQLFRTELISNQFGDSTNKETEQIDSSIAAKSISDVDFLKDLIDYIYKKYDGNSASYKKKSAALVEMKKLAIDSGIIKKQ